MTTPRSLAATLIRTVEGLEWPASGWWEIGPGCPLDVHHVRRLRRRCDLVTRYHGGLAVADTGVGSTLHLVIDASPAQTLATIELSATLIGTDQRGSWQLVGTACADGHVLQVHGTVMYHGVFRSGSRPNAWLELDVELDGRRRRAAPRIAVAGPLAVLAPQHLAHAS